MCWISETLYSTAHFSSLFFELMNLFNFIVEFFISLFNQVLHLILFISFKLTRSVFPIYHLLYFNLSNCFRIFSRTLYWAKGNVLAHCISFAPIYSLHFIIYYHLHLFFMPLKYRIALE